MPFQFATILCAVGLGHCPPKPPPPAAPTKPPVESTPTPPTPLPPLTPAGAWLAGGRQALETAQKPVSGQSHARNVILFIGDGMGLSTVTAARILEGQQKGQSGEENQLSFETFPATALAKTYNTDLQVPESAGAASAMLTGVKTRGASIDLDETPTQGQCREALGHETASLLEQAKDAGLAAGVVATSRITLAVPAAAYAHVSDRDWEVDTRMPKSAVEDGCRDIARQLVEFDHHGGLDLVLGGGRLAFLPTNQVDPQAPDRTGVRGDGVNLIAQWGYRYPAGHYVWTADQLAAFAKAPGPLLGLFAPDAMTAEADRASLAKDEPSLTTMTQAAIARLARAPNGYVLVVDAGGVDAAQHDGNAYRALTETIELSNAVRAAQQMTKPDDTLIIVTADHSHTLTLSGYPRRGAPILGLAIGADDQPLLDARGAPYTTLSYANGPGFRPSGAAKTSPSPLTAQLVADPDYIQPATVPMIAETHAGEDVPIYAQGPGAQWVHGTLEQNVLYWIMHAALGLPIETPPAPSAPAPAIKGP